MEMDSVWGTSLCCPGLQLAAGRWLLFPKFCCRILVWINTSVHGERRGGLTCSADKHPPPFVPFVPSALPLMLHLSAPPLCVRRHTLQDLPPAGPPEPGLPAPVRIISHMGWLNDAVVACMKSVSWQHPFVPHRETNHVTLTSFLSSPFPPAAHISLRVCPCTRSVLINQKMSHQLCVNIS